MSRPKKMRSPVKQPTMALPPGCEDFDELEWSNPPLPPFTPKQVKRLLAKLDYRAKMWASAWRHKAKLRLARTTLSVARDRELVDLERDAEETQRIVERYLAAVTVAAERAQAELKGPGSGR